MSIQHKEFSQSEHNCVIRDFTQYQNITNFPETPFLVRFITPHT